MLKALIPAVVVNIDKNSFRSNELSTSIYTTNKEQQQRKIIFIIFVF